MVAEKRENETELKRTIGSLIKYGSLVQVHHMHCSHCLLLLNLALLIQLKHAQSGGYLTVLPEISNTDTKCSRLGMSLESCSGSVFMIKPGTKLVNEGEYVSRKP